MKQYKLRISVMGIAAAVLGLLPNLVYFFYRPASDLFDTNYSVSVFWIALYALSLLGVLLSLGLLVNRVKKLSGNVLFLGVGIGSLISLYLLWVLYLFGAGNLVLCIGLLLFQLCFLAMAALRMRNLPAIIFVALLTVSYVGIFITDFFAVGIK